MYRFRTEFKIYVTLFTWNSFLQRTFCTEKYLIVHIKLDICMFMYPVFYIILYLRMILNVTCDPADQGN